MSQQIAAYESIKAAIELKLRTALVIDMGDLVALNSVNSALVDLYKQQLNKVG